MFMNSPNKDPDFQENNEVNKFAFTDRFMLDLQGWDKTLKEMDKFQVPWKDKKEVVWWRGSASSENQTYFGTDQDNFDCQQMAEI